VSANNNAAAMFKLAMLIISLVCLPLPANAEKADRSKPIHLEADRVTVDDAKQIATFTGNVVLTQGTLVMRGDRMEVRQDKEGFRHGVMWGNLAYFRQKREGLDDHIEGWAERVEYDGRGDKVQMFSRAMLKRGQDEARGNYISYDSNTEFFQVDGGGPKSAASGKSGDGRVRMILQPKPKDARPPSGQVRSEETAESTRGDAGGGRK
jgi:lipopolysaccharide export system protein LptA